MNARIAMHERSSDAPPTEAGTVTSLHKDMGSKNERSRKAEWG